VPNVVGESPATAARQLESAGLSLGSQAQQCSNQIGQGLVIATSPPANTPAQRGSPVNLIESSGPCPVIVPDLVGQTQGQATTALQGLGLTVNPTTISKCDATSDGLVMGQSPSGGAPVPKDSAVGITVCSATPAVVVPDVVGQTQGQATTTLQGLGLTVNSTTTSECDVTSDGIVVSQSPSGGLSVQEDSTVTITVCDGIETE
jgi:beta-lactam-binding protein with PASTA domain